MKQHHPRPSPQSHDKTDPGGFRSAEPVWFAEFLVWTDLGHAAVQDFPRFNRVSHMALVSSEALSREPTHDIVQSHSNMAIPSVRATNKESCRDLEAQVIIYIAWRGLAVATCHPRQPAQDPVDLLRSQLSCRGVPLTTVTPELRTKKAARHLHSPDDTPTTTIY